MDHLETGQSRHLLPALPEAAARRFEHSDKSAEEEWENEGGLTVAETV